MIIDRSEFDAALVLTHIKNHGKWGVEISSIARKTVRIGGQIEARDVDPLQTAALLTGFAELRSQKFLPAHSRVLITSNSRTFLSALKNDNVSSLQMPNEMKAKLQRELHGFTFSYADTEQRLGIDFANWVHRVVTVYAPTFPISAVSQLA